MKFLAFGTLGMAVLATGCMTPQEREAAKPGAAITQAEGVKAFSDAVLGHCLPAIHTDQEFKDFEVKGVTRLRALEENKISMFENDELPVWQMVEGVVQVQLDPGQSCEAQTFGMPVKASFDVIGNTALQTDYYYSDTDVGYPQDGDALRRVLVSGNGADKITLTLTGTKAGEDASPGEYSRLRAVVEKTPE